MRALIDAKCDIDVTNNLNATALHAVIENNDIEAAELLLANGANVNLQTTQNNSMVHMAIYSGANDMLKLLLQYNPKFEAQTSKNALTHPAAVAAFLGEFEMLHDIMCYLVRTVLVYVYVVLGDCFRFGHVLTPPYAVRYSSTIYTYTHTYVHVLIIRSERPTQAHLTTKLTRQPTTRQF